MIAGSGEEEQRPIARASRDLLAHPVTGTFSDALVLSLANVVARARTLGLKVSVRQLSSLVEAIAVRPVDTMAELKRLVRLTMAVRAADGQVLDAVVEAVFGSSASTGPAAVPTGRLNVEEIKSLLRAAIESGDMSRAAEIGAIAADLAQPEWTGGAGRASNRILRALDLSELLARAIANASAQSDLEAQLVYFDTTASLRVFEEVMRRELKSREDAERIPDDVTAGELEALFADKTSWPLRGRSRSEMEELREALRPLARRLAARARRKRRRGRDELDVRRTLARSVATGGIPATLHFRSVLPRKPRLVVLADVSGSMADYSSFTLSLLEALRAELRDLRCFAFVDGAAEINGDLLNQPYLSAPYLPLIPGVVRGDGHSDYEGAFSAFAELAGDALKPGTVLLVIGDGRTRAAGVGEMVLSQIRSRVKHLYWLTPEPEEDWASEDCSLEQYRRFCDRIDQVSTLAQLDRWVRRTILLS